MRDAAELEGCTGHVFEFELVDGAVRNALNNRHETP